MMENKYWYLNGYKVNHTKCMFEFTKFLIKYEKEKAKEKS